MAAHKLVRSILTRLPLLLAGALAAWPAFAAPRYPQSAVDPKSDYAWELQRLLEQQLFWVVIIFSGVLLAVIYIMIRFRARPGAPEPKHIHGHTGLEVAWTIAPAIILALVAVPTVATIYRTQAAPPAGSLHVRAIGHQWWWEFQYPDLGIVTGTDMHIPIGRPIAVDIETADVIHSFWFPAMGGKRDAIPTHVNHMFFTAESTGTYPGQCAELCGVSHANMRMTLISSPPDEFEAWVAAQKQGPVAPDSSSLAGQGKALFMQSACIACHTVNGLTAGVIGPNLTHVASRGSIAGGIYENTPENLKAWLSNPPGRKPGSLMPNLGLTQDQVTQLVAYLTSLK
jgi:cytochrome c oxidase subunit 2